MRFGLLDDDNWAEMLEPLHGKRVGFVQIPGNAGDSIHKAGAQQLMERAGIEWYPENLTGRILGDVLVYPGGGVLGRVWNLPDASVSGQYNLAWRPSYAARKKCENSGLPFYIFPQSFTAKDRVKCDSLWVREAYSLNFSPQAKLTHDTAMAYQVPQNIAGQIHEPTIDSGVMLKDDLEGIIQHPANAGDPIQGIHELDAGTYILKASEYRRIITDRCHFAIAGLIANQYTAYQREIVLLPNSYHKNLGIWEHSLRDFGVQFWNLSDLQEYFG